MCGENTAALPAPPPFHGSPPRVRGKRNKVVTSTSDQRITPACAGKTGKKLLCGEYTSDHPRVCGENCERFDTRFRVVGSPPRVRGKLDFVVRALSDRRITPACAGKTGARRRREYGGADHPRVCGENSKEACWLKWLNGSPPRVRGKLILPLSAAPVLRITPACAGKTGNWGAKEAATADHPRVCGEN